MLKLPVIRWGQPYDSLEVADVIHFATGEPIATVCQAGGGIIKRDMRTAQQARDALRQISCRELIAMLGKAADLYENGTLPMGDGTQSPDDFVHQQSASTGLPEHMCRANMAKNSFVLKNVRQILDCLTRGLDLDILSRGYGEESRGVTVSYQAQSPVLSAVLPSNSPGVHTLWLPAIPFQLGLVLKPGPQEPWTPYRIFAAFTEAGVPRAAFSLYPGEAEAGAAVLEACERAMIFGGTATVDRYRGNPKVQAHGPGFSKILLGDDVVDDWEKYLELMAESIFINSGRGCINCSGIWASRHTHEIAGGARRTVGAGRGAAADRSAGRSRSVYGPRPGRRGVEASGERPPGAGRDACHGEIRSEVGGAGAGELSATGDRPLRFAGTRDRADRVHVPVYVGREMSASGDAQANWPNARGHRDLERRIVS